MNVDSPRPRWQVPPLERQQRIVGGVCHALATEVGVSAMSMRLAFAFLTITSGWGLVFYGLIWLYLSRRGPTGPAAERYVPVPKAPTPLLRNMAVGLITLGLVLTLQTLGFGVTNDIFVPIGLIPIGFLIAWNRQGQEGGVSAAIRVSAGVLVAAGGMIAVAAMNVNSWDAIRLLVIMAVVLVGLGLIVGPSVARIGSELDQERQERVRADERAKVAAHLHDSVLQTLTLIQKHSDDPKRTAQLARRQERELRSWLYEPSPDNPGTVRLAPALEAVADAVEHDHGVRVEVVTVGDSIDLEPNSIEALVAATREAVTNAAKHAGVDRVDVFAEHRPNAIEVFVRDAGVGFDPESIAPDRHGIRQSISDRMERHGGSVSIFSEPGMGTEVELYLPLSVETDIDLDPATFDPSIDGPVDHPHISPVGHTDNGPVDSTKAATQETP
ncbi:MAG: ATP-binding protein [Acidimicrobiia bacterium]|nr:ATP-binding protein [Acidimicrobiia bacterium]